MVNLAINGGVSSKNMLSYLMKYQQQISDVFGYRSESDLSLCVGNLAHTKGKAAGSARMGTQQSQRTINFAKVPHFDLFSSLYNRAPTGTW